MHTPKIPGPTAEETRLRASQVDQLAQLDDDENKRVKRLTRARLGASSLLGRRAGGSTSAPSGGGGGSSGGGGYSLPGGVGGYSIP